MIGALHMAKRPTKDFSGPAQKYAGQVKIDSGPVQLTRWVRPLTRADHDRPQGADGNDLRPEREPRETGNPPKTRKGTAYNR